MKCDMPNCNNDALHNLLFSNLCNEHFIMALSGEE